MPGMMIAGSIATRTKRLPLDLLRPFESEEMQMSEARATFNGVRNNGPEMMRKAIRETVDGELPLRST